MIIHAYHNSSKLFDKFDEDRYKTGDHSVFINEYFGNKAVYFSERPIPYYSNAYIYYVRIRMNAPHFIIMNKEETTVPKKCDGLILVDDKFGTGAKLGEIVVPQGKQVEILKIACGRNLSSYIKMHKWEEETQNFDNSWYDLFLSEFEQHAV